MAADIYGSLSLSLNGILNRFTKTQVPHLLCRAHLFTNNNNNNLHP